MFLRSLEFTQIDVVAVVWFFALWIGYARFAIWKSAFAPSLLGVMAEYRRRWWRRIMERELRMIDTSIIANLSNTATFFASTTLFILGGLLALMGTTDKVVEVIAELPLKRWASGPLWEVRILLLVGIFVYAFFKFTWSLRLFNSASILVGAAPPVPDDPEDERGFIDRSAALCTAAAESFNYGLRAYYFGLAALAWFLNAWLFMSVTAWVVIVLHRREFHSGTLEMLSAGQWPGTATRRRDAAGITTTPEKPPKGNAP